MRGTHCSQLANTQSLSLQKQSFYNINTHAPNSLYCTRFPTLLHTRTHLHKLSFTHTHSLTLTPSHTLTLTHSHTLPHTHTHICPHSLTHSHSAHVPPCCAPPDPCSVRQQLKLVNCYRLFRRHVSLWIDERVTCFKQGMWKAVNAAEVCGCGENSS